MRRFSARWLASSCLVVLFSLPPFATWASPDEERQRLEGGEIIVSSDLEAEGGPRFTVRAVVEAPVERVWPAVDRCAAYKTFLPRVDESAELSRIGEVVRCRIEVDLPFPLGRLRNTSRATHRQLPGRVFERRWAMTEGDYELNEGSWRLEPTGPGGTRTLITYSVRARPKIAVPDFIARHFQKKGLPRVMEALREKVAALPAPKSP